MIFHPNDSVDTLNGVRSKLDAIIPFNKELNKSLGNIVCGR